MQRRSPQMLKFRTRLGGSYTMMTILGIRQQLTMQSGWSDSSGMWVLLLLKRDQDFHLLFPLGK